MNVNEKKFDDFINYIYITIKPKLLHYENIKDLIYEEFELTYNELAAFIINLKDITGNELHFSKSIMGESLKNKDYSYYENIKEWCEFFENKYNINDINEFNKLELLNNYIMYNNKPVTHLNKRFPDYNTNIVINNLFTKIPYTSNIYITDQHKLNPSNSYLPIFLIYKQIEIYGIRNFIFNLRNLRKLLLGVFPKIHNHFKKGSLKIIDLNSLPKTGLEIIDIIVSNLSFENENMSVENKMNIIQLLINKKTNNMYNNLYDEIINKLL